jgi:hypothetical protein
VDPDFCDLVMKITVEWMNPRQELLKETVIAFEEEKTKIL